MSKKNTKNAQTNTMNYMMLPLMALVFIPIILRASILDTYLTSFPWYSSEKATTVDTGLWGKCIFLFVIVGIMLLFFLFAFMNNLVKLDKFDSITNKKQLFKKWYVLITASFALAFLSTLVSKYRIIGLTRGSFECESIWTLLSYMVVMFYAYLVIDSDNDIKLLQWPLFLSELIVMGYVIYQGLTGVNLASQEWLQKLATPSKLEYLSKELAYHFAAHVDSTLYNNNYVGVFAALILPISVGFIFANKNIFAKLLWTINTLAGLLFAYYSNSETALIAIAFEIFVFAILQIIINIKRKSIVKAIIWILIPIIALIAGSVVLKDNIAIILSQLTSPSQASVLEKATFEADGVHITYKGIDATVGYDIVDSQLKLWVKDKDGNRLETVENENGFVYPTDPTYSIFVLNYYAADTSAAGVEVPYFVSLSINDIDNPYHNGVDLSRESANGGDIFFIYSDLEQTYYYVTPFLKIGSDIRATPIWIFGNHQDFLTKRGFIWGKALPQLYRFMFLGSGADTFVISFPHYDYVAMWNTGWQTALVSKAHCWYLQVWVHQGFISLLCLLAALAIYIFQSIKLLLKADSSTFTYRIGFGIMIGIMGYMVMGITNDSMVVSAPMFWLFFGMGFAVNKMLENNK